jgi:hypothetical protein
MGRGCYAEQLGDCSGQVNREHFLSKNLLEWMQEDGRLQVIGYPHGKVDELLMSAESLTAKVLCEGHNSRLSDVDSAGGGFVRAFFDAQQGLLEEKFATDATIEFDGLLIEHWLLKYACGLIASGQAGIGRQRIEKGPPPLPFLQALFGAALPEGWGLYTRPTSPHGSADRKKINLKLYLPRQPTGTFHVTGVRMEHFGFTTMLALRKPEEPFTGSDLEGAFFRPAFFKFTYEPTGRSATIKLNWPDARRGCRPLVRWHAVSTSRPSSGFEVQLHKGTPPVSP